MSGRPSSTQRAHDQLRTWILDNTLPAGTQMLEWEVAVRLGMSRTPVREAMIRLAEEGLVEVRPRHGMRVLPVNASDIAEIYAVLTALEGAAAAAAARRTLSSADLRDAEAAVARMDLELAADNRRGWAEADAAFHTALVDLAGNSRLSATVAQIAGQAHRVRILTLARRPKPTASNDDHRAVLEAIRRGDAETARAIHTAHRERAGAMLVRLLADFEQGL